MNAIQIILLAGIGGVLFGQVYDFIEWVIIQAKNNK